MPIYTHWYTTQILEAVNVKYGESTQNTTKQVVLIVLEEQHSGESLMLNCVGSVYNCNYGTKR